jgi:heat shock protein HslJ
VAVLALGVLVACSDDSGGGSGGESGEETSAESPSPSATPVEAASLNATTYTSTSVEGHDLVEGTTIELGFSDGSMSVSAGCNTMFGPFGVTDGTLAWTAEPVTTLIGCPDELAAQDQWLTGLFTTGMAATSDGSTLILDDGEVTIELASETVATGDDLSSVLGRSWTAVGTISEGTTTRLPRRTARPTLNVAADGLARLFTGCNSGRTTVQVDGDTLSFANTRVTGGTCEGPARLTEETVLAVLDGPADHVELHEKILIVTKGDRGLLFQLR